MYPSTNITYPSCHTSYYFFKKIRSSNKVLVLFELSLYSICSTYVTCFILFHSKVFFRTSSFFLNRHNFNVFNEYFWPPWFSLMNALTELTFFSACLCWFLPSGYTIWKFGNESLLDFVFIGIRSFTLLSVFYLDYTTSFLLVIMKLDEFDRFCICNLRTVLHLFWRTCRWISYYFAHFNLNEMC